MFSKSATAALIDFMPLVYCGNYFCLIFVLYMPFENATCMYI